VFGCVSARRAFAGYHASGSTAVIAVILAVILDDIDARDCSYCERVSVIVERYCGAWNPSLVVMLRV
jgi:hypothetical protein